MDDSSNIRHVTRAGARERGYSLLEMTLAIGAIAVIAVIAFLAFSDTQTSANQTRALGEINSLVASARQYRASFAQGGLYTDIDMEELVNNGYPTGGMQVTGTGATSSGNNAYGLGVTIVPTTGTTNADATITYTTPSQEECLALMASFTDDPGTTATTATDDHAPGFKAGAVCSTAGALTLIIE